MHPPTLQLEAEYYPTENEFSVTTSASAVNEDEGISTYALSRTSFYLVNHFWSSSNEDVATVDQNGNVTLKGIGETTITVITTYRRYFREISIITKWKVTVYEESDNVFTSASSEFDALPEDVKDKALTKMNEYYNDNAKIRNVIDGNDSDCNTCIFAFEGLGDPSLKDDDVVPDGRTNVSKIHPIWLYNAMMVVTKGRNIVYVTRRASTFPDKETSNNNTTLKEGVYTYRTGNHGWGYDENGDLCITDSTYIGMNPTDDPRIAWYKNNGEFCCKNSWATNLHAGTALFHGNTVYYNSQGCQIIHFKDYISFGKAVGFLKNEDDLLDLTSITSLGKDMHKAIGAVGDTEKDFSQPITVKYILDRKYDNQNPYKGDSIYSSLGENQSEYSNGVFYPLEHKHIENVCVC